MKIQTEYILCAAIWYKDQPTQQHLQMKGCDEGIVLCGWRHANIIQMFNTLTGLRTVKHGERACGETVQGFITSSGRFVDRSEALEIAVSAGQVHSDLKDITNDLYSEDLY